MVAKDKTSLEQIDKEIAALQGKATPIVNQNAAINEKQTLNVVQPETKLPTQVPPVKIPAPDVATGSSK